MAYIKQDWINDDVDTPLSASRLNHMEAGIEDADEAANAPLDMAGLDTVGLLQAVFIENEGTIPPEAVSPYILVIEQE